MLREGNVLYRRDGESTEIEQSHQRKVLKENDSGASVDSTVAQSETDVNPESQPHFSMQDNVEETDKLLAIQIQVESACLMWDVL